MPPSPSGGGTSVYGHTQIYICSRDSALPACTGSPLPSWAMSPTQVWSSWNIKCKLCSNRLSAHTLTVVEYYAFCIRCSLRYVCLFVHSHMELEFLLLWMNMKIIFALNPQIQSWKKNPYKSNTSEVLDGDPEYLSNIYIVLVIKCSDVFISCEALIINCKMHLSALCSQEDILVLLIVIFNKNSLLDSF